MRNLSWLLLFALIIAGGGYSYKKNPDACRKLAIDVVRDATAIYVDPASTNAGSDAAEGNPSPSATADAPVDATPAPASASPAPTEPEQPQHYSMGFQLPSAGQPATTAAPDQAAPRRATPRFPDFHDYDLALTAAKANHVPLLILFTGSDWCPYCQKLDEEVLSTPDFQQYRSSHYVFLTIDDLRNTYVLADDKARINALESKFGIGGFPTLLMIDSDEHEKGRRAGYQSGSGPASVITYLNEMARR